MVSRQVRQVRVVSDLFPWRTLRTLREVDFSRRFGRFTAVSRTVFEWNCNKRFLFAPNGTHGSRTAPDVGKSACDDPSCRAKGVSHAGTKMGGISKEFHTGKNEVHFHQLGVVRGRFRSTIRFNFPQFAGFLFALCLCCASA